MAPEEWLISRICEEFHCTPLDALKQPYDLVLDIMDLRSFARAKEFIDREDTDEKAIKKHIPEALIQSVFDAKVRLSR